MISRRTIPVLLFAVLAACDWSADHRLTALIVSGPEGDAFKAVATHAGIPIELKEFLYDDLLEKAIAAAERDKIPEMCGEERCKKPDPVDLVLLDDPWIPRLLNDLEPLSKADIDFSQFPANCLAVVKDSKDGVYALPLVGNVQILLYNNKLSRPPKSWRELVERHSNTGFQYNYAMRAASGNAIVTDYFPLLWEFGGDLDPARDPPLDRDPAVAALKFMLDLGAEAPIGYTGYEAADLAEQMRRGFTGMSINWLAWVHRMPASAQADLAVGDLPGGKQRALLGIWVLAIPKTALHKEEAKRFLKKLSQQATWDFVKGGTQMTIPPARIDLLKSGAFRDDADRLALARARPRTPKWHEIEAALGFYLSQANVRLLSTEEAIDRAQLRIRSILKAQPTE
jgi:multiple sugar transport system substrate-binding protein